MAKIKKYVLTKSSYHSYDINSPAIFKKIKSLISDKIPEVQIEHTGSTAMGI